MAVYIKPVIIANMYIRTMEQPIPCLWNSLYEAGKTAYVKPTPKRFKAAISCKVKGI